jgi:hypothetical protein
MPNDVGMFGTKPAVYDDRWKYFYIRVLMKLGMKNPYEEKKVEFSSELLKKKALDIRAVKGQCGRYVKQMRYLVGELETLWRNDIQSSFIAELGNMRGALGEFSELADIYAAFLDKAAQELASNPKEMEKYALLPGKKNEPVPVVLSLSPEPRLARNDLKADEPFGLQEEAKTEPAHGFMNGLFKVLSVFGVRNPYEKRKEQTSQALKARALEMRSIISQYDYNVRKMQYMLEDMEKLWENDIQTSLFREFEKAHVAVKDFSNLSDEYASLLEIAVQELQTNNVDADKSSVLSDGAEGPATVVLSSIPYLKGSRIDLKAYDPYYERTQAGVSTDISTSRKNAEYLYNVYSDHVELVKYIGLKRIVEIPGELDGLPVTHIGLDCFAMAWRVKFISITMPDTVTTIYHGAFRGCQFIRELKLSENLRYIGNYAFAFLTDLETLALPENIVSFGMGAFRNCVKLKAVRIPKSTLLRIGNDCFYGCKSLERVDIGDDVIDIDGWAFKACEHLDSVTLGDSVINIGDSAFYNCIRLLRLDVPQTVKSIGEAAFYSRRGMTLGVAAGSAAEKYALENKLPFVNI